MEKVTKKICGIFERGAILSLLIMFLSIFFQIILRNFFNKGSVQIEELARFSSVTLVFLMIPVLAYENGHIAVDMIIERFSPKVQYYFNVTIQVLGISFMIFLAFSITKIMEMNWDVKTAGLRMPNFIFYIPITCGIILSILVFVNSISKLIAERRNTL